LGAEEKRMINVQTRLRSAVPHLHGLRRGQMNHQNVPHASVIMNNLLFYDLGIIIFFLLVWARSCDIILVSPL